MPRAHLLTVVALCYNHERFVLECLDSIRSQTHREFEFLIVDDGSTDQSKAVIRRWIATYDVTCRFIDHPINVGLLPTMNEILSEARGEYLSVVSTDDVWLPEKIERQLECIERLPRDVAVIYQDALQIDEQSIPLPKTFLEASGRSAPPSGWIARCLIDGNFIPALTTMVRREALLQIGGYDERLNYEDWDMWLRLSLRYRFEAMPAINAKYRIVSTSLVRNQAHCDRPQTIYSNVLMMQRVIDSPDADAELRRVASWHMEGYLRQLAGRRDRLAIPAALRFLPAKLRAIRSRVASAHA